jgi:hypothetical protein
MMRRILVDHARNRKAQKRGGSRTRVTLDEALASSGPRSLDLVALDDALNDWRRSTLGKAASSSFAPSAA